MRLPAVAIAAAFACGILLGGWNQLQFWIASASFLLGAVLFLAAAIAVALALTLRGDLRAGAITALLCWWGLGLIACAIASRPLPWGYGLDLDLTAVETPEGMIPVRGGMRIGFTPKDVDPALPEVRAGYEVSIFTQARLPLVYRDAGAFDRRAFLAQQGIDLQATLRSSKLLKRVSSPQPSLQARVARVRTQLKRKLDEAIPESAKAGGILRAMLLGDRSFVDRDESADYQKTGTFHLLVVAGLHVGALAVFLLWVGRKLHLPSWLATLAFRLCVSRYVAVVEQRAPVLRAGLMAAIVVTGGFFYRRLDLLNSAAIAALVLMVANPRALSDTSFQLSFLAIGCIAGIAVPWTDTRIQPYLLALGHWREVSRDRSYAAKVVQFRLDWRDAMRV